MLVIVLLGPYFVLSIALLRTLGRTNLIIDPGWR